VIVFQSNANSAQKYSGKENSLGVVVGEFTGLIGKMWENKVNAYSAAIAFRGLGLHLDYLWHDKSMLSPNNRKLLTIYYGLGGELKETKRSNSLGFRGVGGIVYQIEKNPFEIFGELAPTVRIIGGIDVGVTTLIGARFYL